ncbi:LysE family translocator [Actinoallomurus bryophytorum]|uniref:Threonine/homoserine/homoserine lactone efflux protein n=1 Tax=Actinoallomurus bryophytorum TaxID=1490222 RepID=A0A543CL01_9ACTN|nr:LysE family transporter [Actinoallomurus bryophytorum]TQL97772.1 threonine/homoserine/homoserine lactone efflux protein [Actinoallomurus bryophytorum]
MASYGSFLVFAVVLVLVPGPDFAVVTKNTLASGRWRGAWSAGGVAGSNAVQGAAAATGLGTVIVRVEPLFEAIKWAGVAYLAFLGVQAVRSAIKGEYASLGGGGGDDDATADRRAAGAALGGWRQGFLSNITNPKVLVFYLAVLPQFLGGGASTPVLLVFALSHALLSLLYLLTLATFLHRARRVLTRRRVRRGLDAATGTALLGFSARLAAEH